MNEGKVGAPYQYPESYMEFLLRLKSNFKIGYRETEGISRKLIRFIPGVKRAPDYTTIQQRFEAMEIELKTYQKGDRQEGASDSTGIKTSNRGEYKTIKYESKKKKEYVKLHVMVNIQTQEVIGIEITFGDVHDSQVIGSLVVQGLKNGELERNLMDSGYDGKKVYALHSEKGIEPIIKPTRKGTLSSARKRHEKLQKKKEKHRLDGEGEAELARLAVLIEYLEDSRLWKEKREFGLRWYSEGHFSAFKRIMGEHVFSKKYENIVKELKFKNNIMNLFKYISRGYRKTG